MLKPFALEKRKLTIVVVLAVICGVAFGLDYWISHEIPYYSGLNDGVCNAFINDAQLRFVTNLHEIIQEQKAKEKQKNSTLDRICHLRVIHLIQQKKVVSQHWSQI